MGNLKTTIPLGYCGDIVGSFTYNVMCYGYVRHLGLCIYLNIAGPATGIMSVMAQMQLKDNPLKVSPPTGNKSVPVNAGGEEGWYYATKTKLEQVKMVNALMWSDRFKNMPDNVDEKTCMYVMQRPDDHTDSGIKAQMLHRIAKMVDIPLAPEWGDKIYSIGRDYGLIFPLAVDEGVKAPKIWALNVMKETWESKIVAQVARRNLTITIPQK